MNTVVINFEAIHLVLLQQSNHKKLIEYANTAGNNFTETIQLLFHTSSPSWTDSFSILVTGSFHTHINRGNN